VSFIDRSYPDIVRDVLTNLTQGVTREIHRVDYDADARPIVPSSAASSLRTHRLFSDVIARAGGRSSKQERPLTASA